MNHKDFFNELIHLFKKYDVVLNTCTEERVASDHEVYSIPAIEFEFKDKTYRLDGDEFIFIDSSYDNSFTNINDEEDRIEIEVDD